MFRGTYIQLNALECRPRPRTHTPTSVVHLMLSLIWLCCVGVYWQSVPLPGSNELKINNKPYNAYALCVPKVQACVAYAKRKRMWAWPKRVCARTCVRGCVCGCRCLSVCVCVQVTQSLAKARTTVNKHAEIENGQRNALGLDTPLSSPLPLSQPSLSLSFCAAGQLWRLSTLPTACQPTLLCFRVSCTRTSLALSLSLSVMLSLSLPLPVCLCVCVRVACSQALISTTAKRLSFDLTVTSLPASARLCFIQLPTACKCNFN